MRREQKWVAQKFLEYQKRKGLIWTGSFKELCRKMKPWCIEAQRSNEGSGQTAQVCSGDLRSKGGVALGREPHPSERTVWIN